MQPPPTPVSRKIRSRINSAPRTYHPRINEATRKAFSAQIMWFRGANRAELFAYVCMQ